LCLPMLGRHPTSLGRPSTPTAGLLATSSAGATTSTLASRHDSTDNPYIRRFDVSTTVALTEPLLQAAPRTKQQPNLVCSLFPNRSGTTRVHPLNKGQTDDHASVLHQRHHPCS
jgi:hypothetical protein